MTEAKEYLGTSGPPEVFPAVSPPQPPDMVVRTDERPNAKRKARTPPVPDSDADPEPPPYSAAAAASAAIPPAGETARMGAVSTIAARPGAVQVPGQPGLDSSDDVSSNRPESPTQQQREGDFQEVVLAQGLVTAEAYAVEEGDDDGGAARDPPPAPEQSGFCRGRNRLRDTLLVAVAVVVVVVVVAAAVMAASGSGGDPTRAPSAALTRPPSPTPTLNPTPSPQHLDFSDGFCDALRPFKLNGNALPALPRYLLDAAEEGCPLRLTEDCTHSTASSAYAVVDMCNGEFAFRAEFDYRILDDGGCDDLSADGLAFMVHQDPRGADALGAGGANLGVYSEYSGAEATGNALAIEMDTWNNGVTFQPNLLDNTFRQIHVVTTDAAGGLTEIFEGSCDIFGNRTVEIDYDGTTMTVSHNGCPSEISFPLDLSSLFNDLRVFIGFASGTALSSASHDIMSWSFTQACDW